MKLVNKELFRGDKIIFENLAALQKFKQLSEDCSNLETDVKYKKACRIIIDIHCPIAALLSQDYLLSSPNNAHCYKT